MSDHQRNGKGTNGTVPASSAKRTRAPRRLVLLQDGDESEVESILAEYSGADASGRKVHEEIQQQAAQHRGKVVAAEWLGPLGWTRFLWCRKSQG